MSESTLQNRRPTQRRSKSGLRNLDAYIILTIGGLLMLAPFIYQILGSFMSNADFQSVPPTIWPKVWHFENYAEVFNTMPFWQQMGNTAIFTIIRTCTQVFFAALAGYAFARMRFRGRTVLFGILLAILMVPGELLLLTQYQIVLQAGLVNTMAGLVAPGLVTAFGTFLMRQFFMGLPRDLEDAARIDGAGPIRTFVSIMLPLAKPGLSALAIITIIDCWGQLLWPLIVTSHADQQPVSAGLAMFAGEYTTKMGPMMAASLMAMAPIVILFIVMQRRVIEGLAFSGVKG